MRHFGLKVKALLKALVVALVLAAGPVLAWAAPDSTSSNRFNVVLVMDASGSMNSTDPNRLRDEAIKQFVGLLANTGNELGGVVFTEKIAATQDMTAIQGQADKDAVTSAISAVDAGGDTNIGLAIDTAVNMIESAGDNDNGSVILLLSDGNTDLADKDDLKQSLETKAEAIQRARQDGIRVYTVCLNADGSADTSEMQQISKATGGVFREVKRAEDLEDAYRAFYSLIFGTSVIDIVDDKFPENGRLETEFDIPGIGVEEVNIVIYGKTSSITMHDPDGDKVDVSVTSSDTFTLVKLTDVRPGRWTLVTEGVPGDAIKVNMMYNTNLTVLASADPSEGALNPVDPVHVEATLSEGVKITESPEQLVGYDAEVEVLDSLDGSVKATLPMSVRDDGRFVVEGTLDEGSYLFRVHVTGNYIDRASNEVGPLNVTADANTLDEKSNTPPEAVKDPVELTVAIWPFRDNTTTIDMSGLATDKQDKELRYAVVSSSFMDEDYSVDGNTITLRNYSISKGAFTVCAQDSYGKTCDVEIIVKSYNVGLMAAIGTAAVAVIGVIVVGVLLYIALNKPFYGDTTVQSRVNGRYQGRTVKAPARGRRKLSAFDLEPTGLDYTNCYFQATGDRYVLCRFNTPITYQGCQVKEVRVEGSSNTVVTVAPGKDLVLRFESRMRGGRRRR